MSVIWTGGKRGQDWHKRKRAFLNKHAFLTNNAFQNKVPQAERLLVQIARVKLRFSLKTVDVDIAGSLRLTWMKFHKEV